MLSKSKIAPIQSLMTTQAAFEDIYNSEIPERMMLIHGEPGRGKTTAACTIFSQYNGVLLTAKPGWRQRALLENLLLELGSGVGHTTNARLLDAAIKALGDRGRPLFIDEVDFLFEDKKCLETLRSIHDCAFVPVVLIGMSSVSGYQGINTKIKKHPQISDRIVQWIEFTPIDVADLNAMIATITPGLELTDEVKEALLKETHGNVRRVKTSLIQMRFSAACAGTKTVRLWKNESKPSEKKSNVISMEGFNA